MKHYLVTWHETDGNDATVYDSIIEAPSEEGALSILSFNVERDMNETKTPYSDDGSEFGYYFECSEDCPEDCEGHGGIVLRTVEAFETEQEARDAHPKYHILYECEHGDLSPASVPVW